MPQATTAKSSHTTNVLGRTVSLLRPFGVRGFVALLGAPTDRAWRTRPYLCLASNGRDDIFRSQLRHMLVRLTEPMAVRQRKQVKLGRRDVSQP
jgi:hypothetical protein